MQTIMVVLLEESEDIREDLLLVLLSVLGRNRSVSATSACLFASFYIIKLFVRMLLADNVVCLHIKFI